MLNEVRAGMPSITSITAGNERDRVVGSNGHVSLTEDEIRERMSDNLCRCGASRCEAAVSRLEPGDSFRSFAADSQSYPNTNTTRLARNSRRRKIRSSMATDSKRT